MPIKLTYKKIRLFLLIILLLLNFSYIKLLGGSMSTPTFTKMATIVFSVLLIALTHPPKNKAIYLYIYFCFLPLFISVYRGAEINKLALLTLFSNSLNYLYIILALPLVFMLNKNDISLDKTIKILVVLCTGAYIFRMAISLYYTVFGTTILENIVLEGAGVGWIRDGVLRLNPRCISFFFPALSYYLFSKYRKKSYLFTIIIYFVYILFIFQSRAFLMYGLLTIVFMYCYERKLSKHKLFRIAIVGVAMIAFINSSYFASFVQSFSQGSIYYGSNEARLRSLAYISSALSKNPVLGTGMLKSDVINDLICLSDVGALLSITQMGILVLPLYILMLIRAFLAFNKTRKNNRTISNLSLGLFLCLAFTLISTDCFYEIYAFGVPFFIAIIEHIISSNINKSRIIGGNLQ